MSSRGTNIVICGVKKVMLRFLFPYKVYPRSVDAMLMIMRLLFGGLMMWHGMSKIDNFSVLGWVAVCRCIWRYLPRLYVRRL